MPMAGVHGASVLSAVDVMDVCSVWCAFCDSLSSPTVGVEDFAGERGWGASCVADEHRNVGPCSAEKITHFGVCYETPNEFTCEMARVDAEVPSVC